VSLVRRALLSVSDKSGLHDLARGLSELGFELLSTGGTAAALRAAGLSPVDVSSYTGSPEILDGRVKTLHPKIHGGLLGTCAPEHQAQMRQHGIEAIDVLICNLYPFAATVARPDATLGDAVEDIDIGGPAMLRSAAKNFARVAVVVDPADYPQLLAALRAGEVALTTRLELARKVFAHTSAYDGAVAGYLTQIPTSAAATPDQAPPRAALPDCLSMQWQRQYDLRYGENPHQQAAFYRDTASPLPTHGPARPTVTAASVLGGKQLSYNNLLDLDAALGLALEFDEPVAVVVKHNNPCGVASAPIIAECYARARAADPTSAFGGIVAVNRPVNETLAGLLGETFLECVIAPGFSDEALAVLASKKNLRLLVAAGDWRPLADATGWSVRTIAGGALVQTVDQHSTSLAAATVASERAPSDAERRDLTFAWRVAKHVKSNAIVFARDNTTLAIGAGQMSRVDSVRICRAKHGDRLAGSVAASDAFFPFRDGLDSLAQAGATAVVQPGGSVRDSEVIAAANEQNLAMLFTGVRHFRH
jgi:phosphoribosylaminoimidazolecarboxamide formyltransferase/IMP cyclohydrolase